MLKRMWIAFDSLGSLFAWVALPGWIGERFFPRYWHWLWRADPWWFEWVLGTIFMFLAFAAAGTVLHLADENDRLRRELTRVSAPNARAQSRAQ